MTLNPSFSLTPAFSAEPSKSRHSDRISMGLSDPIPLVFGNENELLKAFLSDQDSDSLEIEFPVCIYGPSGTGKSELANWIAVHRFPDCRITRLNATDFFRDFVDAIDLDNVAAFRSTFCADDQIIIIDNLQELATKPRGLDELEYLLDQSSRLIFTCSVNPADIDGFSRRITSRILNGLSVPLVHPSLDIRRLILANEFSRYHASITDDAVTWLVENVALTIPEIKQVVSSLRIHVDFQNTISLDQVQKFLGSVPSTGTNLVDIAKTVAKNLRVKLSDIKSQSRKRTIVQARGIAVFIAREIYHFKYEELGRYFGNRDHSTIMHAHKKFKNEIENDPELNRCVQDISLAIQQRTVESKR